MDLSLAGQGRVRNLVEASEGRYQGHIRAIPPPPPQPPPRSGEKNPTFRRNVPASRFFSKRGSRCPGSQSQGANTPTFLLVVL